MAMKSSDKFIIEGLGGQRVLRGRIAVGGAKNAVLKALAAAPLFADGFKMANVPEIEDVSRISELLTDLGATIKRTAGRSYEIETSGLKGFILKPEISNRLRASIVLTGPLLARFGEVHFPYPGGCVIGKRPIDMFLSGFEKMGAAVREEEGMFVVKAKDGKLSGAEMKLLGIES